MNKTRMGKRAASLLLSLVMMLSLLPTAAYAAMADGVDTQGAIVSENGTDVSDDSNSSGNTDDLQVGGSEGNGDTGAQQVGDSSGSGTAGDTTGAEGGADPTDSANENDSADPQDDGDAVMPVASSVVSTSEELVAAIAAANDGDTITLGEGEFTTYGNTSPKKSLTFVGAGTGTVWTIGNLSKDVKGEGNGDCSFDGCETITFQNMTLKSDGADYRGFIRISNTAVKKCTLVGKTAYWGYETAKFEDSTFNAPVGDYALWDYSTKAMTFEGCTFNISGKGVNVYVEQPSTDARTVEVNGCTVNSDKAGKEFLNIKNSTQAFDVTLSGTNTVTGLEANGTTGSALYQVETTEVTETTGKPVAVKAKADDGTVTTLYEVKETVEASVAEVNGAKYKSLQAAVDAAKSGATVTLLADTRENVTVSKNAIVLDLNGHTLNGGTENAKPALTVDNKNVTLKDSSEAQTGTIKREDTADTKTSHYVIDIQGKNGFMIVESGKVENNSGIPGVKGSSLIRLGNDSVSGWPTLTIKGGTFTQDNFIAIKVDRGTLHLLGGTVNSANSFAIENWNNAYIKGGTVNGTVSTWVYSTGAAFSKLEISGGTVNGNVASVNYDNAADKQARVYVTGGTVTGTLGTYTYNNGLVAMDETAKATIEVTGGTFSKDPTQYVVEDSAISKNDDGTYGVAKTYLAKIGDTEYYTMDEAFHAVKAGETIVMLRDYTTNKVQNSGDESFTIDLGGHTWTANIVDTASAAFEINYSDVTLTVKNGKVVSSQLAGLIPSAMSGTITYNNSELVFDGVEMTANGHSGIETNGSNTNDTVTLKNSTLNVPNGYGIYFPSSGTLTIDNSVINAKTMGVQVCSGSLNISGAGTAITVTGDGIAKTENDGAIEDGAAISIVNRVGYKGLTNIEVKGGTFTAKGDNAAVKAYKWENQTESAFDNSKNVVAISGGTFSSEVDKSLCAKGFIPTQNADGTYGVKEETRGTEARPYTLAELGVMTRAEYVAAQEALGGTMYVAVGNYTYDKNGVLGNGERNDTPGQNPDHSKLNAYGENGYLNEKNDGANGKNIVFVNGSITSGATGYTSIDDIGTSLLLAVPAYTNVTFKGITFNNVMSFNYQLYTSPWSQLGELKFDGCTFNGIIVGAIAAQTLTFNGCTFTNYTNTTKANSSNPTWIRPAYGNWTAGDNKGQGDNFRSLTKINFTGNIVTSTRPVKFEYISQWDIRSTVTVTNNSFDISAQEGDTEIKNVGLYLGAHTKTNAFDLVADGNTKSDNTAALYTIPKGETSLPLGSTVTNTNGDQIELADALKWKAADAEQDKIVLKTVKAVASVDTVNFATLTEAIGAAQDGQTVTLLADATEDVVISKSITLDLGGKTLTNTNAGKATISVTSGTVTVKNGNVVGGNDYYNIEAKKDANLTLTDVTATAGNNGSSMIDNYGTLTITSGTYTGGLNVVKSEEDSVLNISGGTFTRETAPRWGITGTVLVYGTTTITGGTFNEKSTSTNARVVVTGRVDGYESITYVKGGTFNGNGNNIFHHLSPAQADDSFEVLGGTFNKSIPDYYCADGFIPTKNADGTYGVKEGQYVAQIGSKKYETLADAIKASKNGKTITLLCDVADCSSLTISKNITLDGGGHTISGNSSISVNMPGNAAADVTIKNVNFKDIANGNKLSAFYFSQVKGKLTITGCTFDSIEYEAIQVTPMEGAEVNVSNNVFKAKADGTQVRHIHIEMAYGSGFDCEGQNIKLTVTDNQLHGAVSGDASMGIWWVGTDSTLKVDGNYMEHPETVSITLANSGVHYNRGDLIYPARSQADVDVDDLMPAVIVAEKASGESKIKAYSTLAEAINAAQAGQTVRLLADVEQNTQLTINKSITLDLNGKTIKNTVDIWGDNANAILSIKNGAKVTITGNGTIDAKENDCYTINMVKGDLTIENGTFYGNVSVVQVEEGTLSVKGGTFDLHQKWEGSSKYLFNCIDSEFTSGNAKVAISGGTFVGFDPNVSPEQKVDGKTPSFAAPGVGITKNENGSFTAAAGMTAQILDKDGNSVKAYRTLADAVAAAEDGQTVRLLADVEQNTQLIINKSITLDLNGKTIKISGYTAEKAQVSVKGNLTIQDSSEAQTGKICSDYTGTAGRVVSVENGGKLTIAGGTITTEGMSGPSGSAVYIASGAEVNMTGGAVKVDAKRGNVAMNVKGSTGVFTMSGGSVIAEAGDGTETYITAISGSSGSTIQISAGTVSGPQALFARSSATTITGGSFTGSITVKNGSISGGTFDRALDKKACAAGYVPADNGDGTYGVEVGKFTVKVTSRTTGSDSPVANVAGGGSDITYAEGITVTASAISGYNFVGWFVNEYTGTPYSTDLTCKVKPTDDWTMIAVYEPISGGKFWLTVTASEFTVNGGAVQDSYLYEQFAIGASVTVNFTGSENFLYWVNASNKVVSTEKSYTFIMGSETTLKAVYGKARQNQATVVFISHSDQIISSKAYTTNDTIQFPVPPIKMGCTFTGWSMTEADIRAAMANNSGIIQVRALYTEPSIACKVTVVYPEGTDNQVVNAVVGKAIDVTAKDIEGKTFSYWTDNAGNILGYTKTLKLAPSGDMTVKAVYDQAAEAKPVITMSEVSATTANESYVVTFMATRAVPNGYKVVKQGILWSRDAVCGEDGAAAYMQFDSNGKLPDGVRAYIGNNLDLNGVTRYDIITKYNDRTFYGRGYMVLESDAGKLLYIYTDTIASGSYDSLTK